MYNVIVNLRNRRIYEINVKIIAWLSFCDATPRIVIT